MQFKEPSEKPHTPCPITQTHDKVHLQTYQVVLQTRETNYRKLVLTNESKQNVPFYKGICYVC